MWVSPVTGRRTGYVFYTSQEIAGVDARDLPRGRVWKAYQHRQRPMLNDFLRANYKSHEIIDDPIGGPMVDLAVAPIAEHIPCRTALKSNAFHRREVMEALSLLGVGEDEAGLTGSSALGYCGQDIDIVVPGAWAGRRAAERVREIIHSGSVRRLQGKWGRPYHHRRFGLGEVEVCPRFVLPSSFLEDRINWRYRGTIDARARVVDDSWGHCTPALYQLQIESGPEELLGGTLPLLSSESAHFMAFIRGEAVEVRLALLWETTTAETGGRLALTVTMGNPNAVVPAP
jgi:hypothetical protein